MPLLVSCSCGKKLRVKEELAGKRVKCPACASVLNVPVPAEDEAEDVPVQVEAVDPPPRARKPVRESEPGEEREPADEPFFWTDTTALGGEIIAVSDEALYVASLKEKEFKRAQAALKKGEPIDEVLTEPKTLIPFDQMHRVESNLHHRFIDINWQEPKAKEKTDTNLLCGTKEDRDEIMEALHLRLGWKREVIEYSRLRASWPPLVIIGLFGFITLCGVLAAANPESDQSSGGTKVVRTNWLGAIFAWVFNLFGPVGMALLGSPFILAGVIWFVMRMINPPIMLTLTPRKRKRD
jgi:hypothetical protein